jgi:hypothetical protein
MRHGDPAQTSKRRVVELAIRERERVEEKEKARRRDGTTAIVATRARVARRAKKVSLLPTFHFLLTIVIIVTVPQISPAYHALLRQAFHVNVIPLH